MAEKKPMIVIKKITVVAGGGHGGAWKVAFADFMTAMMAFFLVMWLLGASSEQTKKAVSDYFSTPSVIEYNFYNYGVEITLEKLFLDLVNEPLKTLQAFMNPMDRTPNVMGMGMKKIVVAYLADQLGEVAENVQVTSDSVLFEIPDTVLFDYASATPSGQFGGVMEKVQGVIAGLEDTDLTVTSMVYTQSTRDDNPKAAKSIAQKRLDILSQKVERTLEHESVDIYGRAVVKDDKRIGKERNISSGTIKFELKQKNLTSDGKKPRPLQSEVFGKPDQDMSVYDSFVKQIATRKANSPASKKHK